MLIKLVVESTNNSWFINFPTGPNWSQLSQISDSVFWKHCRTYIKWLFRGEWDDKCANLWLDEWGGIFSWHEKMVSQLSNYVVRFLHLFSFKPKKQNFWEYQNLKAFNVTEKSSSYLSIFSWFLSFSNLKKYQVGINLIFILVWTKYCGWRYSSRSW